MHSNVRYEVIVLNDMENYFYEKRNAVNNLFHESQNDNNNVDRLCLLYSHFFEPLFVYIFIHFKLSYMLMMFDKMLSLIIEMTPVFLN